MIAHSQLHLQIILKYGRILQSNYRISIEWEQLRFKEVGYAETDLTMSVCYTLYYEFIEFSLRWGRNHAHLKPYSSHHLPLGY